MRDFCYEQRMLDRAALMGHMMERHRISPVIAVGIDGGLGWQEARTRCMFCPNEQRCRDWLEGSMTTAGPEAFCPNMGFFRSCSSEILRQRAVVATD